MRKGSLSLRREPVRHRVVPRTSRAASLRTWYKGVIYFSACFSAMMAAWFILSAQLRAQTTRPSPIQFTNTTAAAGIKFTHFKGNNGIPSTAKNLVPASASRTSTATAFRTFTS